MLHNQCIWQGFSPCSYFHDRYKGAATAATVANASGVSFYPCQILLIIFLFL